ncbi:hypothetical protein [Sorangium sp. So ce128]|uniref:hypothetical protein n=1 Tax=Sorangium sp. So ce128 TaxID=3133281 RepID=UPI003F6175E2
MKRCRSQFYCAFALANAMLGTSALGVAGEDAIPGDASTENVSMPYEAPVLEVPASAETTRKTAGVVRWKIYREGDARAFRIFGLDAEGQSLSLLRLAIEETGRGGTPVIVESAIPSFGALELREDGTVSRDDLVRDNATAAALSSMVEDMSELAQSMRTPRAAGDCLIAVLQTFATCGGAAVSCIETAGLGCALAGTACVAAYAKLSTTCEKCIALRAGDPYYPEWTTCCDADVYSIWVKADQSHKTVLKGCAQWGIIR